MFESADNLGVLLLAAGKGTRMRSKTPKVLHTILEEPILYYPLAAVQEAGFVNVAVMVGFGGEFVERWVCDNFPQSRIFWQHEQKGTGHAAKLAQPWWSSFKYLMVLAGDVPLIRADTLREFAEYHIKNKNDCTFLSFELEDPTGYGRVIRDDGGVRVVEHKDATSAERAVKEVNSGVYVFSVESLSGVIDKISCANAQGEYYLPDALGLMQAEGKKVDALCVSDGTEFLGVNDQVQLSKAAHVMRDRIVMRLMLEKGMQCMSPESVWIGPKVTVGNDVFVYPNVHLWGKTVVEDGVRLGGFTVLRDAVVRSNANIKGFVRVNDSVVGSRASAGPFSFMREHAELMENAHIGRYVEIKKSRIGENSKVPHLSYIGDAEVGRDTNIGAGTITCNYDGIRKNPTRIGKNCYVGSDTMFVAPVNVGDDVSTAAGSVITKDIPSGALGVGRAKQINVEGWTERNRKPKKD